MVLMRGSHCSIGLPCLAHDLASEEECFSGRRVDMLVPDANAPEEHACANPSARVGPLSLAIRDPTPHQPGNRAESLH